MKKLFLLFTILTATNALASTLVKNPVVYASVQTHEYGKQNSDWGTAAYVSDCGVQDQGNTVIVKCSVTYPILGPGGGGKFKQTSDCKFLFHKVSGGQYLITETGIVCDGE